MPPILFARTATLGSPAASLALNSIPQTAKHLIFNVRARLATSSTDDLSLDMTINGDATAQYDSLVSKGNTGGLGTGLGNDGLNQAAWRLADLSTSDAQAGIFTQVWGYLPRYNEAEFHQALWIATTVDGPAVTDLWRKLGAGLNDAVSAAITSLEIAAETAQNLAAGSEITVWGLGEDGTILPTSIARSSLGSAQIDFLGDEFKDYTASAGANNFTAINPTLGRTISVRISGGDGSTTIGFPTGTQVLEDNYVAGQPAWLIIRCTNETGPEFIATLKDVV